MELGVLNISLEKVCFFIAKAREFDVKVAPAIREFGGNPAGGQADARVDDQADYQTDAQADNLADNLADNPADERAGDRIGNPAGDRADARESVALSDYPNDPTYEELFSFLSDLNRGEQVALVALAWLGRGDFGKDEWRDIVGQATDAHNGRTPQYLLGMPLLGDYLEEGLDQLGLDYAEFQENRL